MSGVHTLFIVEDHPLMRRMLRRSLERADDFRVVGEAASAEEALDVLDRPDLVLVDLSLPGMSGLEFIGELLARGDYRCLVVSAHAEPLYARAARAAGAEGFVTKDDPDAILAAVRQVLAGESHYAELPP